MDGNSSCFVILFHDTWIIAEIQRMVANPDTTCRKEDNNMLSRPAQGALLLYSCTEFNKDPLASCSGEFSVCADSLLSFANMLLKGGTAETWEG